MTANPEQSALDAGDAPSAASTGTELEPQVLQVDLDRRQANAHSNPAFAAFPAALALMVLGSQIYLVIGHNFLHILESPFLPYCLLGAFAIHMATRPGRNECLWTFGIAAIAIFWFIAFSGDFRYTWRHAIACGSFTGLASLTVLAMQVLRVRGSIRTEKLNTLFAGCVFGYSALFITVILNLTTKLNPQTYDLYVYAADRGFGIPIIVWAGRLLMHNALLFRTCAIVYESLPLAVCLLYAYQRSGAQPLGVRVLPAFIGGGAAAYVLYNFLPACGPFYMFGAAFPNHLPAVEGLRLLSMGDGPRNAMPSMHLACALLICWNCRRLPRWIYGASALYLAFTALATVGLGEHYVIDLVVAAPYALMMQAACAPAALRSLREWKQILGLGATMTAAWLFAVRFGTPLFRSAIFTWAASLATLIVCGAARHYMRRAESDLLPSRGLPGSDALVLLSEAPTSPGGHTPADSAVLN